MTINKGLFLHIMTTLVVIALWAFIGEYEKREALVWMIIVSNVFLIFFINVHNLEKEVSPYDQTIDLF